MIVWYRHGSDQPWACLFQKSLGRSYTDSRNILIEAERMMRGEGRDQVLWHKNEERARSLIWC